MQRDSPRLGMAAWAAVGCLAVWAWSWPAGAKDVWHEPRQVYPLLQAAGKTPVKVDGRLDEWQETAPLFPLPQPAGREQQVHWNGPDDSFAVFRLAWDAERIYVAAEVRDDSVETPHADPGMFWANDGIEIFLDFDLGDRPNRAFDEDDVQLVICPLSLVSGDMTAGWTSPQSYAEPVEIASRRTDGGYAIEVGLSVPKRYRGLLSDNAQMGLDIALNDCDAGNWQTQLRWFRWGKSSEDARARHICRFVRDAGAAHDRQFESTAWTAAPTHEFVVAGRPAHVIVAASEALRDARVDVLYSDENGREMTLASKVAVSGVSDIGIVVPPQAARLVYGAFISVYGRTADRDGILADYPVTVADPEQFAETARAMAKTIAGITRGSETLISDANTAVEQQDADAFRKAVDGLALLKSWGERPEFVDPPVAKLAKPRQAGEQVDLEVYGVAGDYATFPHIYRTEGELLLSFPVQSVELAGRAAPHPHHQIFSDTCWAISRDKGLSWTISRTRPEHGSVLHAARSIEAVVPSAAGGTPMDYSSALKTDAAVNALGADAGFHVFDFGRDANGEALAIGYGTAPALSKRRVVMLLAGGKDGASWTYRSAIASPGNFNLEEPALYTARDGRLVCLMRTGWETASLADREADGFQGRANFHWSYEPFRGVPAYGGHLLQSMSEDNGKTWSEPASTGIWGHPANILRLQSGKVLMVYGHRAAPWSVRAVLSHDDAKTWDPKSIRIIREFRPGIPDLGYPVATQLVGGTILCAYYGYRTAAVLRYPTPHSVFVNLFDEAWLAKGEAPAASPPSYQGETDD